MLATASKTRFAIEHGRIRAIYGHSLPQRLERIAAAPPAILFHGTSPEAAARALKYNLDYRLKLMETALSRSLYDVS